MSIDSLKKQAKNLKRLMPDFLALHTSAQHSLADCQELIARIHGYPNWHAAVTRAEIPLQSDAIDNTSSSFKPLADNADTLYRQLNNFEYAQQRTLSTKPYFLYGLVHGTGAHSVISFLLNDVPIPDEEAANFLHNDIEQAYRLQHDSEATIVLTIRPENIPIYVIQAIKHFSNFGIKLVVVHGDDCSLDTPNNLPRLLMEAVAAAGSYGATWHPKRKERVHFSPERGTPFK